MKKVFVIWCEWDIGSDRCAFTTEEHAREWCRNNESLAEVIADDPDALKVEDIEDQGLLGYHEYEINPE